MDNCSLPEYPGWVTVRKIGSGSYGAVYEIERDLMGKTEKAALKVISIPKSESDIEELYSNGLDKSSITEHFKTVLSDIVHEYQFMADVKGHTNIVYCDDIRYIQKDDGIGWDIYIRMELLTPLVKVIKGEVSEEQVVKLGTDIGQALLVCRNRKILHRDIKPQNIFISKDGDYKLGDFGVAKTAERTSGGTKIGTYNYMAPEVFNNRPYGHSADLYSLGLVMYWMLNDRRLPFYPSPPELPSSAEMDSARRRRFDGEPIPAPSNGSDALKRIVLKACAFSVHDRYATAEEFLRDLQLLSDDRTVIPDSPPDLPESEPPLPQPVRKNKHTYILISCALVFALGLLLFLTKPHHVVDGKKQAEQALASAGPQQWSNENLIYAIQDGQLRISGSGSLPYTGDIIPNWESLRYDVTAIAVEDGISEIGYNAFLGCQNLEHVEFSSTVTRIDSGAFSDCYSLKEIVLSDNIETVQARAFSDCISLKSVTLPANIKTVDWLSFSGCESLQHITIPNKVETIGPYAFADCKNLLSIQLPASVRGIGKDAFSGCKNLYSIEYAGTAEQWALIEIDRSAFPSDVSVVCSDASVMLDGSEFR